jgi:hypothetical protein
MQGKYLTLFILLWGYTCKAQQNYFILLQSENNDPFYAKLNGNLFNSSEKGRLIIPNLKDSVEIMRIGFPQNSVPEMDFLIVMDGRDKSLTLKNLPGKGWVLFDNKTMTALSPIKGEDPVINERDPFTVLMAGVVNDSSILQKNDWEQEPKTVIASAKKENPPQSSINQQAIKDSVTRIKAPQDTVKIPTQVVSSTKKPSKEPKRLADSIISVRRTSFIKKIVENKSDSSLKLSFVDIPDKGPVDTINILIPMESQKFDNLKPALKEPAKSSLPNTTATVLQGKAPGGDSVKKSVDSSLVRKNVSPPATRSDTLRKIAAKTEFSTVNKSCKSFASDYDIDRLRIKMMTLDNDDDRIAAARSVYRQKCFSVKQIRALSELFKTDEGRYKLLDATYTHVSDTGEFTQLQDLLSDPYYIKRFNAMIR